jgi:acyl-coenzyme A thioesterase PaaI-like protein
VQAVRCSEGFLNKPGMRLISLNIAYVSGAVDGETTVETTFLREGKSVDFVHVVVTQDSRIRISVMNHHPNPDPTLSR